MHQNSWLSISQTDSRPFYLQVIEQIQARIAVGDLPVGAHLPSIRRLAADLKLSAITVKRAYLELERAGVIVTRQGKGSVVAESPNLQARVQEEELQKHLERAAHQALLLGLSMSELHERLDKIYNPTQRGLVEWP